MSIMETTEGLTERFGRLFQSQEELKEPEEGTVKGTIPQWLRGTFVRVGPGKFDLGEDFTMNHWFDGYAIIYKFDIDEGKVKFHKKFLQSGVYQRALTAGKPVVTEFGTRAFPEPKKGFFARLLANVMPIEVTDNGFGAIYPLNQEIVAASDNSFFQCVDSCTLASGKKYDSNKLFGVNMISPHPLRDEEGDIYNVGFSIGMGAKFNIIRIPAQSNKKENLDDLLKKSKVICTFPCRWNTAMPFIHSFGMTKNYIVLVEQPLTTPITKLATCVASGSCFQQMTEWRQDAGNKFIIIDKSSGKLVGKLEVLSDESFFFWHIINCYETEDNQIVVDINAYPDASVVDTMMIANLRKAIITESKPSQPVRYIVPLDSLVSNDLPQENQNLVKLPNCDATATRKGNTVTLTPHILSDQKGMELPAINRNFIGKKYDFFYGSTCFNDSLFTSAVGKTSISKKETKFWRSTYYEFPGEPTFVPNPEAEETDEDNGVLLSAVTDVRDDTEDYLLILDAKNLTELARANFKASVPQGLHGTFLAAGQP